MNDVIKDPADEQAYIQLEVLRNCDNDLSAINVIREVFNYYEDFGMSKREQARILKYLLNDINPILIPDAEAELRRRGALFGRNII